MSEAELIIKGGKLWLTVGIYIPFAVIQVQIFK